jgi:hypothetical protein
MNAKPQMISTLTQQIPTATSTSNGGSSVGGGGGASTGAGGGTAMVGGGGGLTDTTPPSSMQPPVTGTYHKVGCSCSGCHTTHGGPNGINARIGEVPDGEEMHPMLARQYRKRPAVYPRRAAA